MVLSCVRCPQAALSRDFVSRASLLMLRLSEPCNTLADQAVLARISEAVSYLCVWLLQCPWHHINEASLVHSSLRLACGLLLGQSCIWLLGL